MTLSRHIKWLDSGPDKLLHARTANLQPKCCLLTWNRDRIDCSRLFVNIHTSPCSFVSSLSMVKTDHKDYGTTVQLVTSFWVYCAVRWLEATNISNTIKTELRAMQDNTCVKLSQKESFPAQTFLYTSNQWCLRRSMRITSKKEHRLPCFFFFHCYWGHGEFLVVLYVFKLVQVCCTVDWL
jgi:hypothetical protein